MKILHVSDFFPGLHHYWGGGQLACKRWIHLLKPEKVTQALCTYTHDIAHHPRDLCLFEINGIERFFPARIRNLLNGIKVIMLPFDPLLYMAFLKVLRTWNPDIIHLHNFKILTFAVVAAARRLKIPTVFTLYDYWPLCPRDNLFTNMRTACSGASPIKCVRCYRPKDKTPSLWTKLPLLFRKPLFSYFMKKIDAFTVLSEASKQLLYESGIPREKIHVIRQYYENIDAIPNSTIQPEPDSVLYVAWIAQNKGAYRFVDAAGLIHQKMPQVHFYLAGDQVNRSFLAEINGLIDHYQMRDHCHLLGKQSPTQIEELLQRCEVAVVPEQWHNMGPIFLTEAMAWAKPIVASRMGGIPEFIEENRGGLLARYDSSEDFAEKIMYLLTHKDEAAAMGTYARHTVSRLLKPGEIKKRLMTLYQTLAR